MHIEKKENYTLISSDENSFSDFYDAFYKSLQSLIDTHIIVELSENLNITEKDISLFLNISESKKSNATSFVLVYKNIDVDVFPEDFNIVPSLTEAEDVMEMEAIERDLGF